MLGVLLIDKERGLTSHDVINQVRRRLQTRRVGHSGTLDPLATGLLVVAVGPATRFLQYLPLEPKEYVAEVKFGQSTETLDAEGPVISEATPPSDLSGAIADIRDNFLGLIEQVPPMYSAIKVDGKPLYTYARQGKEIKREPRRVHIAELEVMQVDGDQANIRVVCSGGTYIRTLADDIGKSIGCGAHLTGLRRTKVGRFNLSHSVNLANVSQSDIVPLEEALKPLPMLQLDVAGVQNVREGRQIPLPTDLDLGSKSLVALIDPKGRVFSIAREISNQLQPECVIPAEGMVE